MITKLCPVAPKRGPYIVVTMCAFSKWVEVGDLPHKGAYLVMELLYINVVCGFGMPLLVRSYCRSEYSGAFSAYLQSLHV